jgi:DNA-binding CsgD family transcriptional regulator
MTAYTGNAYRLLSLLRSDLQNAQCHQDVIQALARRLPNINADTAAWVSIGDQPKQHCFALRANIAQAAFWRSYLALCSSSQDPMSRLQRLSPHPVSHSDIRQHARLKLRSRPMQNLLLQSGMNDAFAVPFVGPHMNLSMVIFAGRNMSLRPAARHLMSQIAADVVARLQVFDAAASIRPQYLELTNRQLEIASWLIAGKTDWEIGEILRISPKTVNFHVENIKRHYGVKSRNQFIAAIVHEGGLLPG